MIGKLYNALAVVAIATLLSAGGLLGFLCGTGRLSAGRLERIAAVLRGELDAVDPKQPSEPAAASAAIEGGAGSTGALAQRGRRADYLRGLAIERARRDVQARQQLLDQALHELLSNQETLASEKQVVAEQRKKLASPGPDKGFEQELEYVSGLAPKQAKEHLLRAFKKQPADAIRLLMNMDVGRGKRIFAQFKTPEELEIMSQLLEQLRVQNVDGYASESGTTDGKASP
jgi:hypothetical protein